MSKYTTDHFIAILSTVLGQGFFTSNTGEDWNSATR